MESKRKAFESLPGNENPQFLEDGKRLFLELRSKYPSHDVEHLDNILNGLCAALTCLMRSCVDKDNHKNFLQLVYKILYENLEK